MTDKRKNNEALKNYLNLLWFNLSDYSSAMIFVALLHVHYPYEITLYF